MLVTKLESWAVIFDKTLSGRNFGVVVGGAGKNGLLNTVICHSPHAIDEPTSYKAFVEQSGQLIAAVPDLVGALREIIALNVQYCVEKYGDASKAETMACVTIARAALKKAGAV